MHIALKKIKIDLERYLYKGSEEQINDIYDVVLKEHCETERGKKEAEKIKSYKDQISLLKKQIKELQKTEITEEDSGVQDKEME